MIIIKWYGAFRSVDGKIVDEYIYPENSRVEILKKIRKGDFTPIQEFIDKYPEDEITVTGEIWDRDELHETAITLAEMEMRDALGDDYVLIQILAAYDDIISILNLLSERKAEFEKIASIRGKDDEVLTLINEKIREIEDMKRKLADAIETRMAHIAPNISALVGPIIGARLIAYAGGLKRLARLPASTIQILGAEDAFFRYLKTSSKCPKHGIIFQVSEIKRAPKRHRGKLARALAGKLAIAARVDFYGGDFVGNKLKEEFEKRVAELEGGK